MSTNNTPLEIRNAHIKHEASIQSIGLLYYLSAVLCIFAALATFLGKHEDGFVGWLIAALLLALGFCYYKLGGWFRALNRKAKTPGTILACFGLLGFPIGTLISAYILYLIQSKKGEMVFSDYYKEVVEATPEVKYRTSKVVLVLLVILALFLGLAIVGIIIGK
jgi:hypothetical protein